MMRPLVTFAALGLAGVVAWKLLWGLLLPLVAVALGAAVFVVKIALAAFMFFLAYKLFQKVMERRPEAG